MTRLIFTLAVLLLGASILPAEEEQLRPGRLSSEMRAALEPGLKIQFTLLDGPHAGMNDTRDARLAALHVASRESPAAFLPAGRFQAKLRGYLKLRLRGEYEFSFKGQGAATLSLNGEQVMQVPAGDLSAAAPVQVELVKGYNLIEITYESPADEQAAAFRLYFANEEFPAEPIPPMLLMHDGRDPDWQQGTSLRRGRLAFARRQCIRCHAASEEFSATLADDTAAMAEMFRQAPSLDNVGARLDQDWLATWIADPEKVRNKVTMPHLLDGLEGEARVTAATDLAAFLAQQSSADLPAAGEGDAKLLRRGEALFEDRGCIACHRFTEPIDENDEYERVSLRFVNQKFKPGALAAFLSDTRAHYSWSRMPKFKLPAEEAQALAGYLRSRSEGELPAAGRGDAARGAKLFASVGCANCHTTKPKVESTLASVSLDALKLDKGCLADQPAGKSPEFSFEEGERDSLVAFLKTDRQSLARSVPVEFSRRQVNVIGCTKCHRRDDIDADLPYVLIDESELGRQPETIPDLTWTGDKLRPDWTLKQFLGQLDYRPRPHFRAHMPAFPERGKLLSLGISGEHGYAPAEDPRPKFDAKLAAVGAEVAAMHTGLACHRCHAIGEKQATAPFEARSTNLSYAAERLRYPFYHRWMRDPLRVDPSTKMIKFAQDGKKTGLVNFYEGDARQQFESVWHWLHVLNQEEQAKRKE